MVSNPSKPERTDARSDATGAAAERPLLPSITPNLEVLLQHAAKFPTIYADPPWPYSNTASRAAAENHYRTMTLDAIRNEPLKQLAAQQAHLHLWATTWLLPQAFDALLRTFVVLSEMCYGPSTTPFTGVSFHTALSSPAARVDVTNTVFKPRQTCLGSKPVTCIGFSIGS
jgi:hypothetical protein